VVKRSSTFVLIFQALKGNLVASVLNIVVLTAALSVYNSCVYCNISMLFGLAKQGNGLKILLNVDSRGIPVTAVGFSAIASTFYVLINYLIPRSAFALLIALVISALVINWEMISPSAPKITCR
jgi:aromatic amino acid transport protein AroP